ncbi:3-hydroxyacyl-CoA dehydrogenase NAD-binding domain-containing protein [Sinomonas sp. ASV486]|uniref:3-hydroxyacyl-CoA dehydrogenase n=1 Tax=Sinomonas sp. ASV486 TaxID=3051170 RepID=UPI0027DBFEFA|nr:3-hydroxyacyl-CoA dehydrogenase NAD-binding domain-containing protein [Sinomonas sp. ASV486]MDQ4488700.1 3-hydroxyacyl-CoA dehydrogenase NAD-binding domain-containing protein [Sinomonas sp. ASV486]
MPHITDAVSTAGLAPVEADAPTQAGPAPSSAELGARRVSAIGVIGAGLMASQLATLFAQQLRLPVTMSDLSPERVDAALTGIRAKLERAEAKGRLARGEAEEIAGLITGTTDPADFAGCGAVIEAVFEELSVKRQVFAAAEAAIAPDALLLTNTSSLSVEAMAEGLAHPERVVGFHFFNPVAVLPLLELVRTPVASDAAMAVAADLAAALGKTAVPVADAPGFVVNRILTRLFAEILGEIEATAAAGGDPLAVDRALAPWNLPMTPLTLIDYIGTAVQQHICATMHRAYPERFPLSPWLAAAAESGVRRLLADDGGLSPEAAALLPQLAGTADATPADPAQVLERVHAALAEEVEIMLAEGVVASAEDIDRCMVLGANYPAGGITPLLAR